MARKPKASAKLRVPEVPQIKTPKVKNPNMKRDQSLASRKKNSLGQARSR